MQTPWMNYEFCNLLNNHPNMKLTFICCHTWEGDTKKICLLTFANVHQPYNCSHFPPCSTSSQANSPFGRSYNVIPLFLIWARRQEHQSRLIANCWISFPLYGGQRWASIGYTIERCHRKNRLLRIQIHKWHAFTFVCGPTMRVILPKPLIRNNSKSDLLEVVKIYSVILRKRRTSTTYLQYIITTLRK